MRVLSRLLPVAPFLACGLLEAAGTVTGMSATPSPASAGSEVAITVAGTGPCQVYVDFGDMQKAAHLKLLPGTVKHVYARPGTHVIRTFTYTSGNEPTGLSKCGGFADMELVVNAPGRSKAFAPAGRAASAASAPVKLPPTPTPGGVTALQGAPPGVGKVSNPAPSSGGAAAEPSEAMRTSPGKATPTPTPSGPK